MACEEKGITYRITPARSHSPEVDRIHPFGEIPMMRYGDFELCESKAIGVFVDRAFRHSRRESFRATVPPPMSELRSRAT
jgi:glutathione S-transferase